MTTTETRPVSAPLAALREYNAAHEAIAAATWDEPAGAASPRGWLMSDGAYRGFYLDYGPEHYRSAHETEIYPGKVVSFCGGVNHLCRDCEPGNVLAVRYPGGPGTASESRYCLTVAEARGFVLIGS